MKDVIPTDIWCVRGEPRVVVGTEVLEDICIREGVEVVQPESDFGWGG